MKTEDIHYIAFGGGGVRGIAYAGAVHELKKLLRFNFSRQLKGIAGTSIGALYAAALSAGMPSEYLLNIARNTSLIDLVSPEVSNLFSHRGLDVGGTVVQWIDSHIGSSMRTFKDLYDDTGIDLRVFVTNLNESKSEYISHATHPNLPVAKGVFMSMCLPPLFAPVTLKGTVYVDGGIMNNFPISTFGKPENTIGFAVKWGLAQRLDSFESYFSRLTYCTLNAAESAQWSALAEEHAERSVRIDCGDVSTLNWRVPATAVAAMELRGREAIRDLVLKFDLRALPISPAATTTTVGTQTSM